MRCLFCSFASPGFLFPMVGLALELRRRGHEVAFVSGGEAQAALDAAGIERIALPGAERRSFQVATWHHPLATAIDVKHLEHGVDRFAPGVLVGHQLGQAATLVRERRGVPLAVMGMLAFPWPVEPTTASARLRGERRWRLGDNLRTLDEARALFRLPPASGGTENPLLGDLFLLRTTPGLERELPYLPAPVRAVGACLWEPPADDAAWDALRPRLAEPEAPLLYVQPARTFGQAGFWGQLLEAVEGRPVQVVASVGRTDQPLGALPRNVLAEAHVPQGAVLPRARAAVVAPTTSAVLATLAHRVPAVVVPTGAETVDNAEKLAELGCALRLDAEGLTAAALWDAVEEVLGDGPVRRGCERAARALGDPHGFGAAAGEVEGLGGVVPRRRQGARALAAAAPSAWEQGG
jgi:UDP:flavonoid glycosyltransferase YjiC (YdhE family)